MTMVYTSTTPRVTTPCPLVTNLSRCSRDSRPDDESRCSDIVLRGRRHDLGPHRGGAWLRGRLAYDKSIGPVHRMPGGRGRRIYLRRAGRGESGFSRQPVAVEDDQADPDPARADRKSTRLNSSH